MILTVPLQPQGKKPWPLITFLAVCFTPSHVFAFLSNSFMSKITGLIIFYCFANFWVLLDGAEKWKPLFGLGRLVDLPPKKTNLFRLHQCTQKYFSSLFLMRHLFFAMILNCVLMLTQKMRFLW